ncbi:helix-turn-helix domain-containing protein [Pedobacter psychroterrae]|uniref:Helix-turn-helix domain-containing protein n=1 Tax=Pedobacter psychroterrae TaxID=2530453 RepID=A0A4R0NNL4_9SPHI|nr:helix-turn-helix domain-containing protein [Pedobacter psychroterrae]TCD01243.1 helix-turn-helix domain-containing protein [Pedobacter psychroterrae]
MKNIELAQRIKDLRFRRGLSQEKLSETAQINLRTVQRIESGETDPRGDTLKRIAIALNVTPDELIDWTEQEDKGFLAFFNLSALSFIVFPLLGIIVPLAIWILKRDKIKYANEMGKRLLNFQISWCLLIFLIYAFLFLGLIFHVDFSLPGIGFQGFNGAELLLVLLTPILYVVNGAFIVINSIRSYQGKRVFYKPAIRFLR